MRMIRAYHSQIPSGLGRRDSQRGPHTVCRNGEAQPRYMQWSHPLKVWTSVWWPGTRFIRHAESIDVATAASKNTEECLKCAVGNW